MAWILFTNAKAESFLLSHSSLFPSGDLAPPSNKLTTCPMLGHNAGSDLVQTSPSRSSRSATTLLYAPRPASGR